MARIRQVAGEIVVEGGAGGKDDAVEHQPQNDPFGATERRYGSHRSEYNPTGGALAQTTPQNGDVDIPNREWTIERGSSERCPRVRETD
jgi:hypothetical protein